MKKIFSLQSILYSWVVVFALLAYEGKGQCLVDLTDASGYEMSNEYEVALSDAACDLVTTYSDAGLNIKVFDFGFYLHNEVMDGGFPDIFQKAINKAAQQSTYYILIGKQTDQSGIYTQFWWDANLPPYSNNCYDTEIILGSLINELENGNGKEPNTFIEAEINGLLKAKEKASKAINCCNVTNARSVKYRNSCEANSCFYSKEDIVAKLDGYVEIPYIINVYENTGSSGDPIIAIEFLNEEGEQFELIGKINGLVAHLNGKGELKQMLFDLDNCSQEFLDPAFNELDASKNNFLGSGKDYTERVAIIKENGIYSVYYKFEIAASVAGIKQRGINHENRFVQAWVIKWVTERALMASINVAVEVVAEVGIEWVFGNSSSLVEAWNNADLKGWSLLLAALEGAIGESAGVVVAAGCIRGGLTYLLDSSWATFNAETFLLQTVKGCLTSLGGFLAGKYIGKAWEKFKIGRPYVFSHGSKFFNPKIFISFFQSLRNLDAFTILAKAGQDINEDIVKILGKDLDDSFNNVTNKYVLRDYFETNVDGGVKAWDLMRQAGTDLRLNTTALGKIDFLKSKNLTDAQLIKIGQLDDIRAIDIADNLAKRTNPSVPINQLDLIPSNAKALESVRPTIMDEISSMSSNSNLRNPDGLHSFLQNAKANPGQSGWKYELDVANEKLGGGSSIEFSKTVSGKEIDILDYTASRIVEVKSYSSGNWTTIAKNLGDDVGVQIGSIDNAVKSQFSEHVGRVRIESIRTCKLV